MPYTDKMTLIGSIARVNLQHPTTSALPENDEANVDTM